MNSPEPLPSPDDRGWPADADDPQAAVEQIHPEVLREFFQQATAILTQQRGINARSRVLLAAAAERIGLNDLQTEQALQLIQDGGHTSEALPEREQAFQDVLRAAFDQLPVQVLDWRAERQWIEAGQRQYGVPAARGAQIVRQAASDASLRLVSERHARGHIYELAAELLEAGHSLDGSLRPRLVIEGRQWGLAPEQVEAVLQDLIRDQQWAETARRCLMAATVAGAAGILAIVAVWLGAWLFAGDTAGINGSQHRKRPAASLEVSGGQWWSEDEQLLVALTKLGIVAPNLKDTLLLLDADAECRSAGYASLVTRVTEQVDVRVHGALLGAFFAGCLIAEPSDACAAALAEALVQLTPQVGDRLTQSDRDYELPFWAVRTVVAALLQPSLPEQRAAVLAGTLEGALGVGIDRGAEPRDVQRQCLAALCEHLYAVILAAAPSQPLSAPPLHARVSRQAERYLDARDVEQRAVDLLAAALPVAGPAWRDYEFLLQRVIRKADSLTLLRLVDVYEQVGEPGLQEFLAARLLRRTGVRMPLPSPAPEAISHSIREALGATAPVASDRRWTQLAERIGAPEAVDAPPAPEQRLQQVVDAAHAAALAAALAQGQAGHAAFDQLETTGPMQLAPRAPVPRHAGAHDPPASLPLSLQQSVLSHIQQLNDRRAHNATPLALRNLAALAPQIPELPAEHAALLARYLLAPKSDQEHQAVLQHAGVLTRWYTVRLGLMDQVLDTNTSKEAAVELISRAVGRDLAPEGPHWRTQLRDVLLRSVLDEPALRASDPYTERMYDDLCRALRDLYVVQARLLGVPAERAASAATPADALQQIIQAGAEQGGSLLPRRNAQPEGAARLKDWNAQLIAIDYSAGNDVQRTVLLQRLWLHQLAAELAEPGNRVSDRVHALLAQLQESDRQAVDPIAQLHAAERARLQMWLLTLRPDLLQ